MKNQQTMHLKMKVTKTILPKKHCIWLCTLYAILGKGCRVTKYTNHIEMPFNDFLNARYKGLWLFLATAKAQELKLIHSIVEITHNMTASFLQIGQTIMRSTKPKNENFLQLMRWHKIVGTKCLNWSKWTKFPEMVTVKA